MEAVKGDTKLLKELKVNLDSGYMVLNGVPTSNTTKTEKKKKKKKKGKNHQ